jgi:YegS/Rv2252/BmrU family lipid kinase
MKRKIIYLLNPISGTTTKSGVRILVEQKTAALQIPFEILHTNVEGNYDYLKEKILLEKTTDIGIIGGDGTMNQVISSLRDMGVNFGIIPMGSGNGLAFAAGIPKKTALAVDAFLSGASKPVDAFLINGQFSCMLSGIGFDAQVAHDFASQSSRGLLTYIKQTILNFFKAPAYRFEVIAEGKSFATRAFFISIANGNQFGNNFTIAPCADLNDGNLDIIIVQKMNKLGLLFAVIKQINGKNILQQSVTAAIQNKVAYFHATALTIKNLDNAPLHIDGEPKSTSSIFDIVVLKSCFNLVFPSN